jgi:hypothetical protein
MEEEAPPTEAAPAAALVPPGAGQVVIAPAPAAAAVVVQPQAGAATAPGQSPRNTPEEKSAFEYKFWHRLHLTLGGGGSFGTRVYGEAEPFNLAAQKLSGPMLFFQPTITLLATNPREEKPNGDFELRAGFEVKDHFLSNDAEQSVPESSVSALSVGALVEGMYHLHRHFTVGANGHFGPMGLISDNADVGAPFSATLEWGSEQLWNAGFQVFLGFWDNNVRAAFNYDATLGNFDLAAGPGNPDLKTAMDPIVGFGIGVDPIGIIRTLSAEKSDEGNKNKKAK